MGGEGVSKACNKTPWLDGQKWADHCLYILYHRLSSRALQPARLLPHYAMSPLGLPSYCWLCHDVLGPREAGSVT